MAVTLPKKPIKPESQNPKKLFLYSQPKCGKTTALAQLEGCLIIDLESGSDYVEALKVKATNLQELSEVFQAIKDEGCPYKYIALDTVTKLEEMVLPLAKQLYQLTPMGKSFTGDNVLTLPNGAGYLYLREAFFKVLNQLYQLAPHIILVGHLKDKSIEKNGQELTAKDIDLTGKIRSLSAADVDAIAYMYRKDKDVRVSFQSSDEVICGARPEHLKGQDLVLSTLKDGKVETFWNRIFIN